MKSLGRPILSHVVVRSVFRHPQGRCRPQADNYPPTCNKVQSGQEALRLGVEGHPEALDSPGPLWHSEWKSGSLMILILKLEKESCGRSEATMMTWPLPLPFPSSSSRSFSFDKHSFTHLIQLFFSIPEETLCDSSNPMVGWFWGIKNLTNELYETIKNSERLDDTDVVIIIM